MAIFSVGWEDKIMQSNTRAAGAVLVTCWGTVSLCQGVVRWRIVDAGCWISISGNDKL